MSASISLSADDGDGFKLTIDAATIVISEIRIQSNSNFKHPFRILGKGQSSIAITQEQLVEFLGEYLRYVCQEPTHYTNTGQGFQYTVNCERGVITNG